MPAGTLDRTAFEPALKARFSPLRMWDAAMKGKPLFKAMPKSEDFGGQELREFIKYGNPQGVAATITTAIAAKSTVESAAFKLIPKRIYGVAALDGMTIATAEKGIDSFVPAVATTVDGTTDAIGARVAAFLQGDGGGSLGRVGSGQAGQTVTLKNPYDIVKFSKGMRLRVSGNDGNSGSLRTGYVTVDAVNRSPTSATVKITQATWIGEIAGILADDYIFVATTADNGDFGHGGFGLKSWLLAAAPTAGVLHASVDRYVDSRLYGSFYDGSGGDVATALINGMFTSMLDNDDMDTLTFMHPAQGRDLVNLLGNKVQYVQQAGMRPEGPDATFGFEVMKVATPAGESSIVLDRFNDSVIAWNLELATFNLHSAGSLPHVLREDGLTLQRSTTLDEYDVRIGGYWQLGCNSPGRSTRIALPVPA